jgi:hypothetical protein
VLQYHHSYLSSVMRLHNRNEKSQPSDCGHVSAGCGHPNFPLWLPVWNHIHWIVGLLTNVMSPHFINSLRRYRKIAEMEGFELKPQSSVMFTHHLLIIYGLFNDTTNSWNYMMSITWPRGLRHELSSLARTLRSWVRIPFKAWMSLLYAFILCLCFSVYK